MAQRLLTSEELAQFEAESTDEEDQADAGVSMLHRGNPFDRTRIQAKAVGALVAVMLALVILFWRWWDEPPEAPWLPRHSLRGDALGCYTLLNDRLQVEPSFMDWRSIVRLDSAAGENVFHIPAAAWRRAQPLDTLGQPSRSSATPPTWSADSLTDTIRLSFFRGFGGDEFAFALPPGFPDTLHGRVTEITDYAPPRRLGVAHAVRVACPT